ncbi:MAG: LamB/YcsF family protein [Acidimicrobiales bacterium]
MTAVSVDLNADVGERYEGWQPGDDEAILSVVTTAHIACGFHSGDPSVMAETVRAAIGLGVAIGAHPSYPDREGFGRREMERSPEQIRDDVLYQVAALDGIARAEGARVGSVKAHGALYNRMAVDRSCAAAVARAVRDFDDQLWLVVPASTLAVQVVAEAGLRVVQEGFCDRGYERDGTLLGRGSEASVITDADQACGQAVRMVTEHRVAIADGSTVALAPDTLCVHGDTPGAAELARAVRAALVGGGVTVAAFSSA